MTPCPSILPSTTPCLIALPQPFLIRRLSSLSRCLSSLRRQQPLSPPVFCFNSLRRRPPAGRLTKAPAAFRLGGRSHLVDSHRLRVLVSAQALLVTSPLPLAHPKPIAKLPKATVRGSAPPSSQALHTRSLSFFPSDSRASTAILPGRHSLSSSTDLFFRPCSFSSACLAAYRIAAARLASTRRHPSWGAPPLPPHLLTFYPLLPISHHLLFHPPSGSAISSTAADPVPSFT